MVEYGSKLTGKIFIKAKKNDFDLKILSNMVWHDLYWIRIVLPKSFAWVFYPGSIKGPLRMALTLHPSLAVHPGDWLKSEIVDAHGVSINRLAASFHVTRQTLSNLFNGHTALSADMAIRFEKAFGIKADTLMRMQTAYDMAQTRTHADELIVDRVLPTEPTVEVC